MKITIPASQFAPSANIHVKIVAADENQLGSRAVAFLLPGGPGADQSSFAKYSSLSDVADIIYHDPRGCGLSDRSGLDSYTMDVYINDIEEIRKQLKLNKIILIGKSYGSMCAIGYALRHSTTVSKLVLIAGAASYRFINTAKNNLVTYGSTKQNIICEKLWTGSFQSNEEIIEFFNAMAPLYSVKAKDMHIASKKDLPSFSYEVLNKGFSDFLRTFDYEPELHKISCSTLILAGENDWINDVSHAKHMSQLIQNSQLKIFTNCGHALEIDAGEPYFKEIREFISQ